ncbi:MAG TPA: zinc ribbon domain-containing protein [Thermoplasmata archaeon]
METPSTAQTRTCVACGRVIAWEANVCPYCGHDYRMAAMLAPPVQRSSKPTAGGVLILVAGILALANGVLYLFLDISDFGTIPTLPEGITEADIEGIMRACGAVMIIFGAIAILGGVFALQRKHFGLAVAGGIMGMLGIGFSFGALLGLVGLILVAISRREFQ